VRPQGLQPAEALPGGGASLAQRALPVRALPGARHQHRAAPDGRAGGGGVRERRGRAHRAAGVPRAQHRVLPATQSAAQFAGQAVLLLCQ